MKIIFPKPTKRGEKTRRKDHSHLTNEPSNIKRGAGVGDPNEMCPVLGCLSLHTGRSRVGKKEMHRENKEIGEGEPCSLSTENPERITELSTYFNYCVMPCPF